MIPGQAAPEDLAQVAGLWQQCFGDRPQDIYAYFARFPVEHTFVLRQGSQICAMVYPLPAPFIGANGQRQAGAYLYAVATAPAFRKQGCCRHLLAFAERCLQRQGVSFTCLRPASPALGRMYGSMGYRYGFTCRQWQAWAKPSNQVVREVGAKEYQTLRRQWLQGLGYMDHPSQVLLCYRLVAVKDMACAAAEQTEAGLQIKEFLGDPQALADILAFFGAKTAQVRGPGQGTAFAQVKPLGKLPPPEGYLGLALD